jgi:glycerol kinase
MNSYLLAIDQGTTSTRAILFDTALNPIAIAQQEFTQLYPRPGWVEHDPEDLWTTTLSTVTEVLARAGVNTANVAAIGITNQRETAIIWDRKTGRAIHNAIVWQDRRTAERCAELAAQGGTQAVISAKTGLIIDPYFSATKVEWILDHVDGARIAAERGELAFGTVDSFLLWRLTGGQVHATDATNAARTMLYNIRTGGYERELLDTFGIPEALMPEVRDCAGDFGVTAPHLFDESIRIAGIAGDQQAAMLGQACLSAGMMKVTFGTGAFALLNTGTNAVVSKSRLLTTVAYQFGGVRTYALEGTIFIAGAAVQWLRDGLQIIKSAAQTQELAEAADPEQFVYLVPAFVGLGAPHWDADARGTLIGLTRGTGRAEFARAALECVAYQTLDLLNAMRVDWPMMGQTVLRADGGMANSDWMLQFLADIVDAPVDRPQVRETTALGAAYLAGYACGLCPNPESFGTSWKRERRFKPGMSSRARARKLVGWRDAVCRTRSQH